MQFNVAAFVLPCFIWLFFCVPHDVGLCLCVYVRVCVSVRAQTSRSCDSLTSVFNLFNPLLCSRSSHLIFPPHDVCLEISSFSVFLMTAKHMWAPCGLHSNQILFTAAIRKVNLIQSSCICKGALFDFYSCRFVFHLSDEGKNENH